MKIFDSSFKTSRITIVCYINYVFYRELQAYFDPAKGMNSFKDICYVLNIINIKM